MNRLPQTDLAYIAGIIDGEGCISARTSKSKGHVHSPIAELIVLMVEQELIRWLHEQTGEGAVHRRAPRPRSPRVSWQWICSTQSASAVLAAVLPYMRVKRRQAELVLQLAAHKRLYYTDRTNYRRHATWELLAQIRALNSPMRPMSPKLLAMMAEHSAACRQGSYKRAKKTAA